MDCTRARAVPITSASASWPNSTPKNCARLALAVTMANGGDRASNAATGFPRARNGSPCSMWPGGTKTSPAHFQTRAGCHVEARPDRGPFLTDAIEAELKALKDGGSRAAPGFSWSRKQSVIFHPQGNVGFERDYRKRR